MSVMVKCKCATCKEWMEVREADRKRGWGKFCSKSCKAIKQTRRRHSGGIINEKAYLQAKADRNPDALTSRELEILGASQWEINEKFFDECMEDAHPFGSEADIGFMN